jgi:hypothetical protein
MGTCNISAALGGVCFTAISAFLLVYPQPRRRGFLSWKIRNIALALIHDQVEFPKIHVGGNIASKQDGSSFRVATVKLEMLMCTAYRETIPV